MYVLLLNIVMVLKNSLLKLKDTMQMTSYKYFIFSKIFNKHHGWPIANIHVSNKNIPFSI